MTAATEAGTAVTVAVVCVCCAFGLTAVVGGTLAPAVLPLTVVGGFAVTTAVPVTNGWLKAAP